MYACTGQSCTPNNGVKSIGIDSDDDEPMLVGSYRRFDKSVYSDRRIDHAIERRVTWPGNTSVDT